MLGVCYYSLRDFGVASALLDSCEHSCIWNVQTQNTVLIDSILDKTEHAIQKGPALGLMTEGKNTILGLDSSDSVSRYVEPQLLVGCLCCERSAEKSGEPCREQKFKRHSSPKTDNSFNSAFPAKHEINNQRGVQSEISSLYLKRLCSHCNLAPVLLNETEKNDVLEITEYE